MAHAFNPSTSEVEVDRSLEFKASLVYIVPGQPELYSETLSQENKKHNFESTPKSFQGHIPLKYMRHGKVGFTIVCIHIYIYIYLYIYILIYIYIYII